MALYGFEASGRAKSPSEHRPYLAGAAPSSSSYAVLGLDGIMRLPTDLLFEK